MIEINNKIKARIDSKHVARTLTKASRDLKIKNPHISVALVGRAEMAKLNSRLRKIDQATDVLSLSYAFDEQHLDGEIIICHPIAKQQAASRRHSIKRELDILLIHALLHLVGHDHKKAKDTQLMQELEEQLGSNLLQRTLCQI